MYNNARDRIGDNIMINSEKIGKLILKLRTCAGVSKRQLAFGICSETAISRLESGEKIPDILTLEFIFSRLGKSINKVEILFQESDYVDYCLFQNLETRLEQEETEEAEKIIALLEKKEKWKKPVYSQYLKKSRAILEKEQAYEKKKRLLEEAIQTTLPDFQIGKTDRYLLGEEEITLILMWLQVRGKMGDKAAYFECRRLLKEIEKRNYDEELWAILYPKTVWILLELEEVRGKEQLRKRLKVIESVRNLLTDNGMLLFFTHFLELELQMLERLGEECEYQQLKCQREALKWVYDTFEQTYPMEDLEIWRKNRRQNINLLPEVIKRERNYLELTQEKLAELADLDQKTLSRVETGNHAMKPGTFHKVRKALQLERELYSTKIDVDDFELLELERDLTRELVHNNQVEAKCLYKELKEKLPHQSLKNKQYLAYIELRLVYKEYQDKQQEMLQKLLDIFEISRQFKVDSFRNIALNQVECSLLLLISECYGTINGWENTVRILEAALEGYDNSRIEDVNYYKELTVILGWLTDTYEENNQFEKALEYSKRNIRLELKCGRSNLLATRVMEYVYIFERKGEKKDICIQMYQYTYQLYRLLNPQDKGVEILKKHLKDTYQVEIEEE